MGGGGTEALLMMPIETPEGLIKTVGRLNRSSTGGRSGPGVFYAPWPFLPINIMAMAIRARLSQDTVIETQGAGKGFGGELHKTTAHQAGNDPDDESKNG